MYNWLIENCARHIDRWKMSRPIIFVAWTIMIVFVSFIVPQQTYAAGSIGTKVELYNAVWFSNFWIYFGTTIIGGVIASFISMVFHKGCLPIGIILVLGMAVLGGRINANSKATQAIDVAWEDAITEKATYIEKLLGVFVAYKETIHSCNENDTDMNIGALEATGCVNVYMTSYCDSYDTEGDCDDTDYRWYPMFTQEVTRIGVINVYKNGDIVFCDHCAPGNWHDYIDHLKRGAKPVKDFRWNDTVEWNRVVYAVDNGLLLLGTVYNTTLNYRLNGHSVLVFSNKLT